MPYFTVIVPTYNRITLLRKALKSVFAQSFTDYELIVVDDGSTDGTWETLQVLAPRIKCLHQENAGPGAARNVAARHARGKYLLFLDSDDWLTSWALDTIHYSLTRHSQVSHLIGNAQFTDPNVISDITSVCQQPYREEYSEDFLDCSQENRIWASCFAVIDRQYFQSVGGFDTSIRCHEDQDMSLKLGCAPRFVRVLSPATVYINRTPDSLSRGDSKAIFDGISTIIQREKAGEYPGGKARELERRAYISVNVRNQSLMLSMRGDYLRAWSLYRETFGWHMRLTRFRYLFGFPAIMLRDWGASVFT